MTLEVSCPRSLLSPLRNHFRCWITCNLGHCGRRKVMTQRRTEKKVVMYREREREKERESDPRKLASQLRSMCSGCLGIRLFSQLQPPGLTTCPSQVSPAAYLPILKNTFNLRLDRVCFKLLLIFSGEQTLDQIFIKSVQIRGREVASQRWRRY